MPYLKQYDSEEWERLLKMGQVKREQLEQKEADRRQTESLMLPDAYSPPPKVRRRYQPIVDYASEVTIKKADGTVEIKPAYTPYEMDKIRNERKWSNLDPEGDA